MKRSLPVFPCLAFLLFRCTSPFIYSPASLRIEPCGKRHVRCAPSNRPTLTTIAAWKQQQQSPKSRVNPTVRQHMEILEERLGLSSADKSWKKTRAYLYRSTLTDRQIISAVETLLACKVLSKELVRHVVQSSPRILRKNPKTYIEPTLDFLLDIFGKELLPEAVSRNPNLLLTRDTGYNGDDLELVSIFLQCHLGMSESNICKLKKSAPRIFQIRVSNLLETTLYLSDLLNAGDAAIAQDERQQKRVLCKIILSHPNLLQLSVDRNLKPRIEYLRQRCRLEDKDVKSLIKSSSAGILGLSVEDNLAAKLDIIEECLANPSLSRQCILRHPQILGLSLENIKAKLAYFSSIDKALPGRLLARSPAVFSLRLEDNIVPKIAFLAGVWGLGKESSAEAFYDEKLGSLLAEYPTVLTLSLESNLRPTVDFFNRTGYTHLDEEWCLKDSEKAGQLRGRYLAASLYKRLLPRWHFAQSMYEQEDEKAQESGESSVPLHLLAGVSDKVFCEALGESAERDYKVFLAETYPRLKFSSQFATWLKSGTPIEVY